MNIYPALVHPPSRLAGLPNHRRIAMLRRRRLERETGIEPATNSLEGCDSTTELLPPSRLAPDAHSALRRVNPQRRAVNNTNRPLDRSRQHQRTLACQPQLDRIQR